MKLLSNLALSVGWCNLNVGTRLVEDTERPLMVGVGIQSLVFVVHEEVISDRSAIMCLFWKGAGHGKWGLGKV
jgi:hypothetical protein